MTDGEERAWDKVSDLEDKVKRLEKEVFEVRQHLELTEIEWGKDTTKSIYFKTQLTQAKGLLNEFMRISKASDEDFEHDYSELIEEAEQFLKEVE